MQCGVQFCSFPIISASDFWGKTNKQLSIILVQLRLLFNTYALPKFLTSLSQNDWPCRASGFLKQDFSFFHCNLQRVILPLKHLEILFKFLSIRCSLTLSCIATVVGPPRSSLWRNEDVPFFFNSCGREKHTHNNFISRWAIHLYCHCCNWLMKAKICENTVP